MKFAWKQVSSITTSQRHLGSHIMEPTENLHPGDVYQNKVTGYTYEWSAVEESESPRQIPRDEILQPLIAGVDKPQFDFSRTPSNPKISLKNAVNEFNEAIESFCDLFKNNNWHERGELPPVGIECEYKGHSDVWHKCKIAAHVFEGNRPVAIIQCANAWTYSGSTSGFRPLKSERERAIEKMLPILASLDGTQAKAEIACGKLYDLGFRKEGK